MVNYYGIILGWIHIVGVVIWIGGSLFIAMVLTPSARSLEPESLMRLNKSVKMRFTPIAMISAIIVGATGFARASYMGVLGSSTSTSYGMVLMAKILLFIAMIAIGLAIAFTGRGIDKSQDPVETSSKIRRIEKLALTNIILGLIVILLAVTLRTGV